MTTFHLNKDNHIYPYDADNMRYWSKKWHVSSGQLQEAILETGSLEAREIRRHLIKKGKTFAGALFKFRQELWNYTGNIVNRLFFSINH